MSQYLADKIDKGSPAQPAHSADTSGILQLARSKAAAPKSAAQPTVIYKTNEFRWSQLESTDYRQYIANLRAISCPEGTIKDIILTDVMKLYAARRGQFYTNGREFKFWETDEKRKLKQSQIEEREKQLALIDKELPAVLRELLGINYEREINKYFVDTAEDDHRLAFLSEDKRSQLSALRDQFEGQREVLLQSAGGGKLTPGMLEKLKEIDTQRDAALGKILSPDEREQYDLCTSGTADRLRGQLIGFNPSETEFRQLFRLQQALDAKYACLDPNDESVAAAKATDEASMRQQIKAGLGDARVAEYDRVQNTDLRDLYTFGERFDLPASTVQALSDIRQMAETERRNLAANKEISDESRFRALKAIQAETEHTLQQTLGEKAFAEYSQSTGTWIQKLGPN
jgi:hypothetical protein